LRLVVPTSGTTRVEVVDESWTPLSTAVGGKEWITSSVVDAVEIGLDHSLEKIPQQVSIPAAWIRSHVDAAGNIRTVAQYESNAELARLVVRLPAETSAPRFTWNGEDHSNGSIHPLPEISGQYLVDLHERENGGWLGITYAAQGRPLGWGQETPMGFPAFGHEVTLERTFWDLH